MPEIKGEKIECAKCNGRGKIEVSRFSRYNQNFSARPPRCGEMMYPIFVKEDKPCPECKGTGVVFEY